MKGFVFSVAWHTVATLNMHDLRLVSLPCVFRRARMNFSYSASKPFELSSQAVEEEAAQCMGFAHGNAETMIRGELQCSLRKDCTYTTILFIARCQPYCSARNCLCYAVKWWRHSCARAGTSKFWWSKLPMISRNNCKLFIHYRFS